ncbi:MAG: permease [Gammaproteobacteria bacterium]|nr:permease [Gammaproteobacteria bacterium]
MSYLNVASGQVVADLPGERRAAFVRRTYGHLAMAIAALAVVESQLLNMGMGPVMLQFLGAGMLNKLLFVGLFIGAGIVADNWARSNHSKQMQYVGLGLYIVAEALILLPLLYLAQRYDPAAIMDAAIVTAGLVTGLTYVAFTTRKDFSFLGPFVAVGMMVAIGAVVAGILFGFNLGVWFSFAVVALAAASLLYQTSNVLHVYKETQHVAAALGLFASVALMFRFILDIFMHFGDD